MTEPKPRPWKPDGPHMLILSFVEGKPIRKRFYGVEAKNKFLETIAYFKNEADRDFFLAAPALLEACEALLQAWDGYEMLAALDHVVYKQAQAAIAAARPEAS